MLIFSALAVTLFGHVGIWVAAYNQMNAANIPRWIKKSSELAMICATIVLGLIFTAIRYPIGPLESISFEGIRASAMGGYALVCWMFAGYVCIRGLWWAFSMRRPTAFLSGNQTKIDLSREIGRVPTEDGLTRLCASLPGNEIFKLEISQKEFQISDLPRSFDGLTIAHLSDVHMTGRIDREFYDEIVNRTNQLKPDLVVITGDIVDKAKCLQWIEPVFSRLKSRHGVYYVLGNHDRRIRDEKGLRKRLKQAGMTAANSRWLAVNVGNGKVWLAGNELPWFKGAEKLAEAPPNFDAEKDTKILLSHSPDQFRWACKRNFNLVLAGHTHGGQIRIPAIGPIVSPSRYGVKYASGVFKSGNTMMHVSRGISGVHPLRWNCAPEISLLTLRSDSASAKQTGQTEAESKSGQSYESSTQPDETESKQAIGSTGAA